MEQIRNKFLSLQKEVEEWERRSEAADMKNKEQEILIAKMEEDKASLHLLAELADEQAEKARKDTRDAVRRFQDAKTQNETLQRELASVTSDRDLWQKKYDEMVQKYSKAMQEFNDFVQSASNM
ncbi:hypothetical protein M407DRAFT_247158 [Tulasnella calospora MUT 4182]|uniref:Uncharacterized protein n=1 Tax=Tulasnella calospora MUT 4182 TaxID=1051891 RepID=A0A0C3Q0B7_9AGAM|nr:hypothetical protein M407DRAFT_247158 [Tulasnella calospora MUT 4182]